MVRIWNKAIHCELDHHENEGNIWGYKALSFRKIELLQQKESDI